MTTERAWPNGPLRVKGSGMGKQSRYVCDDCKLPVNGIYRAKRNSSQGKQWLCSACSNSG